MKYYLLTLPYIHGSGYQYPENYENDIGQHNQSHVYFEDLNDNQFKLLISIPNDKALTKLPENVVELTEVEALALGDIHDPAQETITNEAVVRRLEIKSRLGTALTAKEQAALDPTNAELGFGLTDNFSSKITKSKVKLNE